MRTFVALVAIAGASLALGQATPRAVGAPPSSSAADANAARSPNAYGHALVNLQRAHWQDLRDGKAIFLTTWVARERYDVERAARGPGAQVRAGLGDDHNAASCDHCHFRDGRGGPPRGQPSPYLVRLSVGDQPDPRYGSQLQDRAFATPEATLALGYAPAVHRYPDGTLAWLRAPVLAIGALRAGPLMSETRTSLRIPPSLIGLGLLEAVPAATICAAADPEDADGDGISGRAARLDARGTLGRFGWKASQPSVAQQNARALRDDLGVTTSHDADAPALSDADLALLTRYLRLLEPPARRDRALPDVLRGERAFVDLGCARCHQPELTTGIVADLPELSRRTIAPYSDLLLHDLGDALADHRAEGAATGREWRTAPLWGLGVLDVVSGEVRLLHDGRARSAEEAILWHGGEAQAARDRFVAAPITERAALLRFLASL